MTQSSAQDSKKAEHQLSFWSISMNVIKGIGLELTMSVMYSEKIQFCAQFAVAQPFSEK